MKLSKLLTGVASGIGAIFSFGLLLNGCEDSSEDVKTYYGPAPISEAEKCCQKTLQFSGDEFDYCVNAYKGTCDAEELSMPLAYYGPAPISEARIEECCGSNPSAEGYDDCIKDLQEGVCDSEVSTDYGPISAADACCGKTLRFSGDKYDACVEAYNSISECDENKLFPVAIYGPAIDPAMMSACCGEDTSADGFNDCLDDLSANVDACNKPVKCTEKAIEKQCGAPADDATYTSCVSDYKDTNSCEKADKPLPTYYGAEPVEDI